MLDFLTNIPHLLEPPKKETLMLISNECINKHEEPSKQLFDSCYRENFIRIGDNVVSHLPARVYNGLEDLAEKIMNPINYEHY